MATMIGSEKQVAWAEKIRDEFVSWQTGILARSEKDLAREMASPKPDAEAVAEYQENVANDRAALDGARRNVSAKFWIENRSASKAQVANALSGKKLFTDTRNFLAYNPVFEDAEPVVAEQPAVTCEGCLERVAEIEAAHVPTNRIFQVGGFTEIKLGHRFYVMDRTTIPLCSARREPTRGTYLDAVNR